MKDKVAYALGTSIGMQLQQMGANELNITDFSQGVTDALAGKTAMDRAEMEAVINEFFTRKSQEQAEKAKAEGAQFLAENAKKEGVVTLPSGLQYQVLREGNGKKPKATDQVRCHYEGTLINGTVFDSKPTSVASPPCSDSTRSSADGPKAYSSCRKAPSTDSSSPTISLTASAAQASRFRPTLPSSSMSSSSK